MSGGLASAGPSVRPLRRVDLGEQSEEGGSQVCPVLGALDSEDSWMGLEGQSRVAGLALLLCWMFPCHVQRGPEEASLCRHPSSV